jgi:protein-disulfide isomerase
LSRIHFLVGLLALGLAVGCKAQSSAGTPQLALNRRIEVAVRAQYNLPSEVVVTIGAHQPSTITGYDTLPITLSQGGKSQVVDFLISPDGKTLARLDKFDLANDPAFSINLAGRPIRGNPAAKVTVVSFDDLECPFCSQMHHTLFPAALDRYKDNVRYVYKDNPLTELHPWAVHGAVDANCLAAQSGAVYWDYVDYVHSHSQEVNGAGRNTPQSIAALDRIARQEATLAKLDLDKLNVCLTKQDETEVRASMREARELRVDSAPIAFVNGERIDGALPQSQVWMVIDRALRSVGVEPPAEPSQPATKADK